MTTSRAFQRHILVGAVFLALAFLVSSPIFGIDKKLYFTLFDDAMVSMRYARMLVAGEGLVWNPGEFVEGYTNPLWTLYMAFWIALTGPFIAPLCIQLSGLLCYIFSVRIAGSWNFGSHISESTQLRANAIAGGLVLLHYPLLFWSVQGMEVAPLTLSFLALSWLVFQTWETSVSKRQASLIAVFAIIMYGLRPDGLLLAFCPILFRIGKSIRKKQKNDFLLLTFSLAVVFLVILSHLIWRQYYYGEWVPNTLTLKLSGVPLAWRIEQGLLFMKQYLFQYGPLFLLLVIFLPYKIMIGKVALSAWVISIAYQVSIGGDPWPFCRQLVPANILLCIAASLPLAQVGAFQLRSRKRNFLVAYLCLAIAWALAPHVRELLEKGSFYRNENQWSLQTAQGLRTILPPNSTIAVFWAGTLPYYWEGPAFDMLGKTNTIIAHQKIDPSVFVGHNKYDLDYVFRQIKPAYMEDLGWYNEDIYPIAKQFYEPVSLHGIRMWIRRDLVSNFQ